MPIVDKRDPAALQEYQSFVRSVADTHFYQDPRWTRVHDNLAPEFVTVCHGGRITAAATVYVRPIAAGYSLLYVNRGPVSAEHSAKVLEEVLAEMRPLFRKYKAFAVRFDPNWQYNDAEQQAFLAAGFVVRGRGYSKRDLVMARRSMVFYLRNRNIEQLMAMFRPKTRRNINKSLRSGLTVEQGFTKAHLDVFMDILEETARRDGIEHRPREFFEKIAANFTDEEARLYLIRKDDVWLAGAVGINYAGHLYYYHSGSAAKLRNLQPNCLMQYELIKWAAETGCHTYDMGGIISEDLSDGLYQFKIGYCNEEGSQEYFGEIDKPLKPLAYRMFIAAYGIVQKYRRARVVRSIRNRQEEKNEETAD